MPSTSHKFIQHIVLAAVFNADHEVLLLKRPVGAPQGGLWSFPGGKVETDKTPLDAAQRELFKETGTVGHDWKLLGECEYSYSNANLLFPSVFKPLSRLVRAFMSGAAYLGSRRSAQRIPHSAG